MKNLALLVLIVVLVVAGGSEQCFGEAKAGNISFETTATPLAEALNRLQQVSGLRLAFEQDVVKDAAPVTLAVKDQPVDAVLQKMLRPRGLEAVYTGEAMVAIVRADTPAGIAKMRGRAYRAVARLALKIDGARLAGDDIVLPDWSAGDSAALIDALGDIEAADFWVRVARYARLWGSSESTQQLDAFDPDVRAGCTATCPVSGAYDEQQAFLRKVDAALDDQDPIVRAAAFPRVTVLSGYTYAAPFDLPKAIGKAAAEPDCAVRLACINAAFYTDTADVFPAIALLRTDPHAAVRLAAWKYWLQKVWWLTEEFDENMGIAQPTQAERERLRNEVPASLAEGIRPLLADPNPVVRSFGLVLACSQNVLRPDVPGILAAAEASDDPCLQIAAAAVRLRYPTLRTAASKAKVEQLRQSSRMSHLVLRAFCRGDKLPLSYRIETAFGRRPTELLLLEALQADDPIPHLLLSLFEPILDATRELAPEIRQKAQELLRSPALSERVFGATLVARQFPGAESVGLLRKLDPASPAAKALAGAMLEELNPSLHWLSSTARRVEHGQETPNGFADAILASGDAQLQRLLWYGPLGLAKDVTASVLFKTDPDVVLEFLSSRTSNWKFEAADLVQRLGELLKDKDAQTRAMSVRAFNVCLLQNRLDLFKDADRRGISPLIHEMLKSSLSPEASPAEQAAGIALAERLIPYYNRNTKFIDGIPLPALIAQALRLASLNGDECASLAYCLMTSPRNAIVNDRRVAAALVTARDTLLDKATANTRIKLLCGMAASPGTARGAAAELQRKLLAGDVPRSLVQIVITAIAREPSLVKPEFLKYLQNLLLGDQQGEFMFRHNMMETMMALPDGYNAMLDTLAEAAKGKHDTSRFTQPVRGDLGMRKARREKIDPQILRKAADLGLTVAKDRSRNSGQRSDGLELFVKASGDAAASTLAEIIMDGGQDIELRRIAATQLADVPESPVYSSLLEGYAALPATLRAKLAESAAASPKAPAAEDFVIRLLKDTAPDARGAVVNPSAKAAVILALKLPLTDRLRRTLDDLRRNPELQGAIDQTIERMEKPSAKSNRGVVSTAPLPDFRGPAVPTDDN